MALAFNDAVEVGASGNATSETIAVTISGADRCVWVWVNSRSDPTVSGVTVDGVSMGSSIATVTRSLSWGALYRLIAPNTGTVNVVGSWGSSETNMEVLAYTGVDQTTPEGTVATATGSPATSPSVTVSSSTSTVGGASSSGLISRPAARTGIP